MDAYFLDAAETLTRRTAKSPEIAEGEVLLQVNTTGICGSDIEYYLHYRVGDFIPREPLVLGHELAGEVVEHGPGVTAPAIGTAVAIDPSIPCRRCRYCRRGRHNLCTEMRFIGTAATYPHISGGFGEYVAVPAENCIAVPETVSWRQAACLEPLAVAVHAALRPERPAGSSVLVAGGGTIGQLIALVARAFGATSVTLSDIEEHRRRQAVENGADRAVNPLNDGELEEAQEQCGGFDLLFEASGAAAAVSQLLYAAPRGATVVQVGSIAGEITLPANRVMSKELTVLGSFRYGDVFPLAMELIASGKVDVSPLVTASYPFDRTPEAFAAAAARGEQIKVQVDHSRA